MTPLKILPLLLCFLTAGLTPGLAAPGPAGTHRVLLFSRTLGFRHASITNGIAAILALGAANGFAVEATEDSGVFTATNLARFQAVVFLSVTGDVLNPEQELALQDYIETGGGFAAIHGALFGPLACEDKWAWYGDMFRCAFTNHSKVLPGAVNIEDAAHPANAGLPARWERTEEWYNYTGSPRSWARILATVDESTYSGGRMGADHPIIWCRRVGKGRMWFTAMGHTPKSFDEPLIRQHLLNGIRLAAGWISGEFEPNDPPCAGASWRHEPGSVALTQKGRVIWQFNFATNATKPFFHPVALPGGPVLTWDRPTDHVWHRALWFSWKFINGLNYWEENPKTGAAQGLTVWSKPQIETRRDLSARIAMDISYRPATNGQAVLTEHRVIEISPPDADGAYRQDWAMTFTAGGEDVRLDRTPLPGEPGGAVHGGYAGLSVRFSKTMQAGQAVTMEGPAEFVEGRHRSRSMAMDYSGEFDGSAAGIAILDAPASLNSPTPWYAISKPFHYFSPAVICYQPQTLKAGQQLSLRYRVIVHPGRWSAEQLGQASRLFTIIRP
ncbi:MAG: ThuA domain-containing protein [Limisphaerales bacterium]